jgi:glycosyltransferase involved in cell wall biosynthesis
MRVWLVTDHYPPQRNGHAVAVAWWARALAQRGVDVTVIADAWPGAEGQRPVWRHRHYREERLRVLPFFPPGHPLAGLLPSGRRVAGLPDAPPDVLHLHGYGPSCEQAAAALPDVGRVISVHALPEGSGASPWPSVQSVMRRRLARIVGACDVVVAPSEAAAARVREVAGCDDVRVIPTGVDEAFVAAARGGDGPPDPARPRVLYVGRLSRDKGFGLVTALAEMHPEASWLAIGEGSAATTGVTTLGHRPLLDVALAVCDADVLLAPAVTETQGLAAHEAIVVGTPVAAPRGSAQAGIVVDGVNGAHYDPSDLDDAWRAVVRAAGVSRDGVLSTAADWRPDRLVETMLAVYDEAGTARGALRTGRATVG